MQGPRIKAKKFGLFDCSFIDLSEDVMETHIKPPRTPEDLRCGAGPVVETLAGFRCRVEARERLSCS